MPVIVGHEGEVTVAYGDPDDPSILDQGVFAWQLQYRGEVQQFAIARAPIDDLSEVSDVLLRQCFYHWGSATCTLQMHIDDEEGPLQDAATWFWNRPDPDDISLWEINLLLKPAHINEEHEDIPDSRITGFGILLGIDITNHIRQVPVLTVQLQLTELKLEL